MKPPTGGDGTQVLALLLFKFSESWGSSFLDAGPSHL